MLSKTDATKFVKPLITVATVIQQHLQKSQSGVLKISSGWVTGLVYLRAGKLIYITHTIDPVLRLDLLLRGLSGHKSTISVDVRNQLRLTLDPNADLRTSPSADLEGLSFLVQTGALSPAEAQSLLETLSREALESLLLMRNCSYSFIYTDHELDWIRPLNFAKLMETCVERLLVWQSMRAYLWSPYQIPIVLNQTEVQQHFAASGDIRLGSLLRGFSLRHLASLTDQDELEVARKLYPLAVENLIKLCDPHLPYRELPTLRHLETLVTSTTNTAALSSVTDPETELNTRFFQDSILPKPFRVACIDHSSTILHAVGKFLAEDQLSLFLIQDSLKALIEVMEIKPDLILLDANLPIVSGFEFCRLLRKHPLFKSTPIIMLTDDTGLIDRAQAIVAGATDFIIKPFTQSELSKVIFQHLPKL